MRIHRASGLHIQLKQD